MAILFNILTQALHYRLDQFEIRFQKIGYKAYEVRTFLADSQL